MRRTGSWKWMLLGAVWYLSTMMGAPAEPLVLRLAVISPVELRTRSLEWMRPFAVHLEKSIPGVRVEMVPVVNEELERAVLERRVDFAIPLRYDFVRLENCCGANVIATLRYPTGAEPTAFSASVAIVSKADPRFQKIQDLATARVVATDKKSFSGYLMVVYELRRLGIDTRAFEESASFVPSEAAMLDAVRSGRYDAMLVSSFRLRAYNLDKLGLRPLPADPSVERPGLDFPFSRTTDVYPGSPFVQFQHVPNEVATKVAIALLTMPVVRDTRKDYEAGWVIPLSYGSVHRVIKELRLGPYENEGKLNWRVVLREYWWLAVMVGAAFLLLATAAVLTWRSRRTLEKAHQNAVALAEAKVKFLATMSHEIRTPLFGILGMAEMAWRKAPPGEEGEVLGILYRSSQSLLLVLNNILDSAKIEAGRLTVEQHEVDLRELLEEVVEGMAHPAQTKGVQLLIDHPFGVAERMTTDSGKLRQILFNLVGNAVKFTERGTVTVRVRPGLTIAVEDTGIGIPPEQLRTIFDPFTQADSSINRRFGGTGLGLSIARGLAQKLGGTVTASSAVGEGSRFVIWLPDEGRHAPAKVERRVRVEVEDDRLRALLLERLGELGVVVDGEAEFVIADGPLAGPLFGLGWRLTHPVRWGMLRRALEEPQPLVPKREVKPVNPTLGGLHVLVVDDNAVNRRIAEIMLTGLGCLAESVGGGVEAIEKVQRERYDAMLLDCNMPEMDGFAVAREIRKWEQEKGEKGHLPILAFTASPEQRERELSAEAGMDGLLGKPISIEALREALEGFAQREKGVKEAV